jgi:hypothetical protein
VLAIVVTRSLNTSDLTFQLSIPIAYEFPFFIFRYQSSALASSALVGSVLASSV